MNAQIVRFPNRFSRHEEIEIEAMLKAGNGIGGVRPRTKLLWLALCEEGREARMDLVFKEVERRAYAMQEATDER